MERDAARQERQLRAQLEAGLEEAQQQASLLTTQAADLQADYTLLQQRLSLAQMAASQAEEQAAQRWAIMPQNTPWKHYINAINALQHQYIQILLHAMPMSLSPVIS